MTHIPVLLNEVIENLDPKANENFVDCTIGEGGHSKVILEKIAPQGKVLGIDLDERQIINCKENLKEFENRLVLVHNSYSNIKEIVNQNHFENINGILLDAGFSSWQTDESKKGFSFLRNEELDMRFNTEIPNYNNQTPNLTAKIIVNEWSEKEIEKILTEFGEENFAKKIAKEIIDQRKIKKIETTFDLVAVIKKAIPTKFQFGKINCATRTFQALRIAVNGELKNLEDFLPIAFSILSSGGRLAVISFHSLEDRIVKNYFKELDNQGLVKILTKKPIEAGEKEVNNNPRSRSAKLRVITKI